MPGQACSTPTGDYKCVYKNCGDGEFGWAWCSGGTWKVTYVLCDPPPCHANAPEDPPACPPNSLCVERPMCSIGAAKNCVANPCQYEPLSCNCAGSLCGPYLECVKAAAGVLSCFYPLDEVALNMESQPVAFVKDQPQATNVVLAGEHVYWAAGGEIRRVQKQGGKPEVVAAVGADVSFVADTSTLIAADRYAETILKVPHAGGTAIVMASGFRATRMAINDDRLFFIDDWTSLWWMPKDGGVPKKLAPSKAPRDVLADNTAAFWMEVNPGRIRAIQFPSGTATTLAEPAIPFTRLAKDETSLFWLEQESAEGPSRVVMLPKIGGEPQVLASGPEPSDSTPNLFAVADGYVYWSAADAQGPATSIIQRVPIAGGAVEPVVQVVGYLWSLAIDKSYVYWTNSMSSHECDALWRKPLGQ